MPTMLFAGSQSNTEKVAGAPVTQGCQPVTIAASF